MKFLAIAVTLGWLATAAFAASDQHGFIGLAVGAAPASVGTHQIVGGASVEHIKTGGPADKAGIKINDVVIAVDGTKIDGPDALRQLVTALPPDRTVKLEVLRWDDQSFQDLTIPVVLSAPPA